MFIEYHIYVKYKNCLKPLFCIQTGRGEGGNDHVAEIHYTKQLFLQKTSRKCRFKDVFAIIVIQNPQIFRQNITGQKIFTHRQEFLLFRVKCSISGCFCFQCTGFMSARIHVLLASRIQIRHYFFTILWPSSRAEVKYSNFFFKYKIKPNL